MGQIIGVSLVFCYDLTHGLSNVGWKNLKLVKTKTKFLQLTRALEGKAITMRHTGLSDTVSYILQKHFNDENWT